MFRTHLAFSLMIASVVFPYFQIDTGPFLAVFILGTLVPDIDSARSLIGQSFPFIGWIFRHRGLFHSFLTLALLSSALGILLQDIAFASAFALGYLSHLVLDMLNHQGIRPFYPLMYRIKGPIRTGSVFENGIFVVCIALCLVLLAS